MIVGLQILLNRDVGSIVENEEGAMYHRLKFLATYQLDFQPSGRPRLEQLVIHEGTVVEGQVRPYVAETDQGPCEMADVFLPEGTLLAVPMACFCFL